MRMKRRDGSAEFQHRFAIAGQFERAGGAIRVGRLFP